MSDGPKTTQADLAEVFDHTVDYMKHVLTVGEPVVTKDGAVVYVKPGAAMLGQIRQFLKDQNINASPKHAGVQKLATDLPFAAEDEGDDQHTTH